MSRSWMSHVLPVALGGGVSPTVSGRWGSPRLPQQRSTLPFQLTRCFPNYEQGLKRQQKKKKEAQTYSRKGLPGGSRRRTRRGPRPEMVTAASRRLRISPPPPPSPVLAPHALSGMHPAMPDRVPTTSYTPKVEQLLGFVANTPPPQNLPSLHFTAAFAFSLGHQLTGS